MKPDPGQVADVCVSEGVEIEHAAIGVTVLQERSRLTLLLFLGCLCLPNPGSSSPCQVLPQHFGGEIRQECWPYPSPWRLSLKPDRQRRRGGVRDGLGVGAAPLRVTSVDRYGWGGANEIKRFGHQRREFAGREAGVQRQEIKHLAIFAAYLSNGPSGTGHFEKQNQLLLRQTSSFPANIHSCVHVVQVGKPILFRPTILNHPVQKGLHRGEIIIAAADTQAASSSLPLEPIND